MHTPLVLFCVAILLNAAWQILLIHVAARLIAPMMRTFGPRAEHRVWIAAWISSLVLPACHLSLPLGAALTWLHLGTPDPSGVRVLFGPGGAAQAAAVENSWPVAILLTTWCAWSLVAIARLVRSLLHARSLARSAEPLVLSEAAAASWAEAIQLLPPERQPRLACSRFVTGPVTIGLRRALLLLPLEFAEQVSKDDLAAAFAHEIAHAARRDVLRHLVYTLLAIPVDWHPVLRSTALHLADTRELVCDAMAADILGDRRRYARSLLRIAAALPAPSPEPLASIGLLHPRNFERRIMALTQRTTPTHPYRRPLFAAASLALALLTASSALALRFEVPATPVAHVENTRAPQVSAGEMAGRKKSGATPEYPAEAREKQIQGKVTLALTINAEGEPEDIRVVESPNSLLTDSAIKAVQTWRWEPYELDGKPVPVDTTVNVTYSLAG